MRKKLKQKAQNINAKYWSSNKPQEQYKINLYCEGSKHETELIKPVMMPYELPNDKELIKILRENFKLKKFISLKVFKRTFIYFKCPICHWEKFVKLQQIFEEGYINPDICKNCPDDVCLWINCNRGGYIKNENKNS